MPRKLSAIVRPVPDDLTVAQACVPLPISAVAEELGLTREDYDEHGKSKAKARAPQLGAPCRAAFCGAALASQPRIAAPRLRRGAGQTFGAGEAGKPSERLLRRVSLLQQS